MASKDNVLVNTDKRIFYLSDDIDNSTIAQLNFNILYILDEDARNEKEKCNYERKPIRIYINSNGGEVYDMWSLIDIMLNSKTPIYTYCTGYAMSAAFNIFLAGAKRFISEHATLMYHQISCWRSGKYQDLVENRIEIDIIQANIEDYIKSRCSITSEMLSDNRFHKRDWYIHPNEAITLGVATDFIS